MIKKIFFLYVETFWSKVPQPTIELWDKMRPLVITFNHCLSKKTSNVSSSESKKHHTGS